MFSFRSWRCIVFENVAAIIFKGGYPLKMLLFIKHDKHGRVPTENASFFKHARHVFGVKDTLNTSKNKDVKNSEIRIFTTYFYRRPYWI